MSTISRDDLMHLTMKMSKRIKMMEGQNAKLKSMCSKFSEFTENTKKWVKSDVLPSLPPRDSQHAEGGSLDLMSELDSWRQAFASQEEERNNGIAAMQKGHIAFVEEKEKEVFDLERQLREVKVNQVTGSDPSVLAETLRAEITKLESDNKVARAGMASAEMKLKTAETNTMNSNARADQLEAQLKVANASVVNSSESLKTAKAEIATLNQQKNALEEKVVYLQMQQQSSKEATAVKEELQTKLSKVEEGKEMLKRALTDLRTKHKEAVAKITSLESSASASALLLMEKDALIQRLRDEVSQSKAIEAELLQKQNKEEVNALQIELEGKTALVNRLRQEAEVQEKAHATRTALIATREANIDALKLSLEQEVASRKMAESSALKFESSIEDLTSQLASLHSTHTAEIALLNGEKEALEKDHIKEVESLKQKQEEELQRIRDDNSKKSSLARQLVAEKDATLKRVTTEVEELRSEVESGGHSEKKIMALAKSQAQREAEVKASVTQRESELLRIHQSLKLKEEEAAESASELSALRNEVSQLRRMSRRDGVNMEYLKNIVLQFICLRDDTQRRTLARVLQTLLQFSPEEKQQVEDAYSGWGLDVIWEQFSSPVKTIRRSSRSPDSPISPSSP